MDNKQNIQIHFLGAAGTVTTSRSGVSSTCRLSTITQIVLAPTAAGTTPAPIQYVAALRLVILGGALTIARSFPDTGSAFLRRARLNNYRPPSDPSSQHS